MSELGMFRDDVIALIAAGYGPLDLPDALGIQPAVLGAVIAGEDLPGDVTDEHRQRARALLAADRQAETTR